MSALAAELFDYPLPPGLIAQEPAARRDQSRLLVVDRAARSVHHRVFSELPAVLCAGDILFRNNATVIPARLRARRATGGRVECLLLERTGGAGSAAAAPEFETWRCLVKPGRKLPAGSVLLGEEGAFIGEIAAMEDEGVVQVNFRTPCGEPMVAVARRLGEIPLPPYIERKDASRREEDRRRYQTVYADPARPVAAAAPTAGLHFTPELIGALDAKGVRKADLTLHVGLGTFRPIAASTIDGHRMHRETYEIPASTQRALFPPGSGAGPGRRIAVGTTSARAIEDFLSSHDAPMDRAHIASTALYLRPPCAFRGVDALITNFHQPRSTLLCLVAAFLSPGSTDGVAWIREIYAEAVARRYRFFSYGDAMLIL